MKIKRLLIALVIFIIGANCGVQTVQADYANHSCKANERKFSHSLLQGNKQCLPAKIKRVVALEIGAAEFALLNDINIVGAPMWLIDELYVLYPNFKSKIDAIENVGLPASIEKIIKLAPDAVLSVGKSAYTHRLIDGASARQVVNLITADASIYRDWKLNMQFWAQALGKPQVYKIMQHNYQQRIDQLHSCLAKKWQLPQNKIRQKLAATLVSVASINSHGIYMWQANAPTSAVIQDIGFGRVKSQQATAPATLKQYKNNPYLQIGKEYLYLLDSDYLFVFSYITADEKQRAAEYKIWQEIQRQKLWQYLKVAKNKRAYYTSSAWFRSNTYLQANRVLDDIADKLCATKLEHTLSLEP